MNRPVQVLQIITHLDLGGAEEIALTLCEHLQGEVVFSLFAVMGVRPTPVGQNMLARLRRFGIPVFSGTALDMKRGGLLQAAVALRRVLSTTQPDVVHLHTDIPDATYAASTLLGSGAPRVLRTIHNTALWPRWRRIGRWTERRLEQAQMIGVTPASLLGLQQFRAAQGLSPLGEDQCHVISNGVAEYPPAAQRRPGPLRILFAGRFEPQKGADLLPAILESAASLTSAPAEVSLYGHGSLGRELEAWVLEQRLPWTVRLAAPVPGLREELSDFDVVIMPSRFEGLALLGIETLMSGTPLIAADISGLRELLPPDYELLAQPEDVAGFARQLARVLDDPQPPRERARHLIAPTAAQFGLGRMTQQYLQHYKSAARGERSFAPDSP